MRIIIAACTAVAALVLSAGVASAHEEISPSTIQTGKPTFFLLTAANEKSTDVTKVVVAAPSGTALGETTKSPAGWTANRTESSITWTGGHLAPDTFDQWGFEIDGADQPGTLSFKVTLTAGSDSEDSTVPVTVVAGNGTATPPTSTSPTVTAAPVTAAPSTTAPSGTAAAADPALAKQAKDAKDRAGSATTLAVVALALGLIALLVGVMAAARRRPRADTPAAPGAPDAARAPQDF